MFATTPVIFQHVLRHSTECLSDSEVLKKERGAEVYLVTGPQTFGAHIEGGRANLHRQTTHRLHVDWEPPHRCVLSHTTLTTTTTSNVPACL